MLKGCSNSGEIFYPGEKKEDKQWLSIGEMMADDSKKMNNKKKQYVNQT